MPDTTTHPSTATKLVAEALGTFLLVFGSIGAALFASDFGTGSNGSSLGIGFLGVSLAFGLTLLAGIYTWGPISGGHFNPAVTLGLAAAGRFSWRETPGYVIAQVIGGAVGTTLIVLIGLFGPDQLALGRAGQRLREQRLRRALAGRLRARRRDHRARSLFTAIFILVILGVTHPRRGTAGFAGLAIGLTLTLIHLASIPIDNTSVNPARSIATAIYGGGAALGQLWVFIVFPTRRRAPRRLPAPCALRAQGQRPACPGGGPRQVAPSRRSGPPLERDGPLRRADQTRSNRSSSVTLPHAGDEVADELLGRVVARVHLGEGAQLRVRAEQQVDARADADRLARAVLDVPRTRASPGRAASTSCRGRAGSRRSRS